jgi:hypothetical protein
MSSNEQQLASAIRRLNARAWGWAFGLIFGLGLFLATMVLVIRGGPDIGAHLGLLSVFLPGYNVSWLGAVIGFVYLFVIGYGVGRLIGSVYNLASGTD